MKELEIAEMQEINGGKWIWIIIYDAARDYITGLGEGYRDYKESH
jgi:bacteriocin-like protein